MLEKIKSLKINFALIAFLCFTIKMIALSASPSDSVVMVVLGALYGYTQYLKRFEPYKLEDAVMKDLQEVKIALSQMKLRNAAEKMADKKYF